MELESLSPSIDSNKCCSSSCSCSSKWHRSVKRKLDEIQDDQDYRKGGSDLMSFARVEIENECTALREALASQLQSIQELHTELEEERNASSSAANEAMSMILRLQREKAEITMELRQFKRFTEEKMAHDQQELITLEDLLYKREQVIQSLNCEVEAYKHRLMSVGYDESGVEIEQVQNNETQIDYPVYDYPPLKCNLNETPGYPDLDEGTASDVEKYAFGETPRTPRDHLQNLEYRICQLERTPSNNQLDGEYYGGARHVLEKGMVGQSPRRPRHSRRLSADSPRSFYGFVKESSGQDCMNEMPKRNGSFKKMDYFTVDNTSDIGDDTSDRVYTIDSVHRVAYDHGFTESKAPIGICEDYLNTPRESLAKAETGDGDIKRLYMRLQALEADRESMRQALITVRTDKAQLVLLKEIAQQLYKEMSPEKEVSVKKPSLLGSFSFMSTLKWVVSLVFWKKKAHRSKYTFGLLCNNVGLLLLLDKSSHMRPCLTRVQM